MYLGQLAGHRDGAVPTQRPCQLGQIGRDPRGGREEDDGAGLDGQVLQTRRPFPPLAGKEAFEDEAVRVQAGYGQSRHHCARSRYHRHNGAGPASDAHRREAGIGHPRHPGVGDEGNCRASFQQTGQPS